MQEQAGAGFWLSPQQAHLWLAGQQGGSYNAISVIELDGAVEPAAVRTALDQVIARHEVLRTLLQRVPGVKVPFQVVQPEGTVDWDADIPAEFDELLDRERNRKFDLERGPALHALLAGSRLVLTLPAIFSDGPSLLILAGDIRSILKGEALPEAAIRYVQFAQWQRDLLEADEEGDGAAGQDFWKKSAASAPPVPVLPGELAAVYTGPRKSVSLQVATPLLRQMETVAAAHATTLAEVLLGAWEALVWRLTGQPQFRIAVFSAGREYEELRNACGLIGKSLPVTARFEGDLRFSDLVRQAHAGIAEAAGWQEYYAPEDSAAIAFDYAELPAGVLHQEACSEPSKLKLSAQRSGDNLTFTLHFDAARLESAAVQEWGGYLLTLLAAAATDPRTLVSRLPMLSEAQRYRLLTEWNRTEAEYPRKSCIHELFEEQAALTPDRPAVQFEDEELTYRELNERSNQLAHALRAAGVGADSRVGLCVDRGTGVAVALLAILKAGGAYVPVSADHPKARLAQQLNGAAAVVMESKFLAQIPETGGPVLCLDRDSDAWSGQPRSNPERIAAPDNLAYVIFTSGSTGVPKGVAVRHRNLVNYATFIQRLLELDRHPEALQFATVSTFSADLGNTCVFPSLISGGCLHIIAQDTASDSQKLRSYTARYPVDVLKIVPSHLAAILEGGGRDVLPRRYLITGGEALTPRLVAKVAASGAGCEIVNHYGPTETTVGSLTLRLKDYDSQSATAQTIPIGRPVANTRVYILDAQREPVPVGVTGELYIAGAGVTAGYLNQPERTDERFLPDPFAGDGRMYRTGDLARYLPDGNVEFLGRADDQVKIRGFRIELGEIEAALSRQPNVKQAFVMAREDESDDKRLVAYVVGQADSAHLRTALRDDLPEYMIPTAVVVLPKLPLNANGKIDRLALPLPEQAAPAHAYVAPRTPTEAAVASVWETVLRRERIGVDDDFFQIGGHSLLATQIASRLREKLKAPVAVRLMFDHATIAALAAAIDNLQDEADDDAEMDIIPIGRR
jgi:amino acid adenylation domain-containing protein